MKLPRITIEDALWVLVLLLALGIRLLNLGTRPLSDYESSWALQALSLFPAGTNIEPVPPGPQPGPIALTGFLFYLLGSSNGLARFLPAFAGSLLCLTPYFFRLRIGRLAAIIMAFGLALDPGLVAVSRLAGGPMPALGFGLFGIGLLVSQQALLAGICLGLALISGPAAIQGMVYLVITWGIARLLGKIGWMKPGDALMPDLGRRQLLWVALSGVGIIFLAGTLFGYFPQGLGAWVGALPAYLTGWVSPSGVPAARLLAVLLLYQPLAVIFGLAGLVVGWKDRAYPSQWLSIWFIVALGLAIIFPARQLSDLVWVSIPLWGLASLLLSAYLPVRSEQRLYVAVQALIVFILMSITWLHLAGLNQPVPTPSEQTLRWLVFIGVLLLVGLTTILVGLGWSWDAGIRGLVWGVTVALVLYGISGMWASSQPVASRVAAIWNPAPLVGEAELLQKTVSDLSIWSTGRKEATAVVAAVDSPSLRWLLRLYPNARFTSERQNFSTDESVPIIITRKTGEDPTLAANYRGQDFAWWIRPEWSGALPANLPAWSVYHQIPEVKEEVILWGRADLFPGVTIGQDQPLDAPIEPENQDNESIK